MRGRRARGWDGARVGVAASRISVSLLGPWFLRSCVRGGIGGLVLVCGSLWCRWAVSRWRGSVWLWGSSSAACGRGPVACGGVMSRLRAVGVSAWSRCCGGMVGVVSWCCSVCCSGGYRSRRAQRCPDAEGRRMGVWAGGVSGAGGGCAACALFCWGGGWGRLATRRVCVGSPGVCSGVVRWSVLWWGAWWRGGLARPSWWCVVCVGAVGDRRGA